MPRRSRPHTPRTSQEPVAAAAQMTLGIKDPGDLLEIYTAILESAPDAMIVADTDGRIVFLNEQTLRLFGYERDGLMGQSVEQLVPQRFRANHPEHRRKYAANPHFRAMGAGLELYGQKSDGSEFPVEISLSPIRFKDRLFVAAAIRDATDRVAAQRSRQLATDRLQRIQRLEQEKRFKAHFLNMVSHELNTPITPIKLQLHLLEKNLAENRPDATMHSLGILQRNMNRLARLVGDVLDVSRLEAGRLKISVDEIDLAQILVHTEESFQGPAHNQHGESIRLRLELPRDVDLTIRADPDRLQQVFDNLVANAVRLSPVDGQVTIRVHAENEHVDVRVEDEGPGLSKEQITRLFKPFSQVHGTKRDHSGTGLGLYVSRGIVEAHGGNLSASSPGRDQGAVFTVRLPRIPSPKARAKRKHVQDSVAQDGVTPAS